MRPTLAYDDVSTADLVVEAVFEDMAIKQQVFAALDRVAKTDAVLATNTSTLDVDRLAQSTRRPQDVAGMHFFSPANVMKLVEVVRGAATAPHVLATLMSVSRRLGKTAVVSRVCDGFIGNRMIEHYLRQAMFLVDEGASPAQVDAALERFGMAMGPFRMGDLTGLDVGWRIRQRRYAERPHMRYSRIADRLCEQGRFGQKTGAGWYRYEGGQREALHDPAIDELIAQYRKEIGATPRAIADDEIVDRCILALVNEGARIVEDGIAQRASDIDVVYLTGYGFPRFRGGPMHYANERGLRRRPAAHARTCRRTRCGRRVLGAGAPLVAACRRGRLVQVIAWSTLAWLMAVAVSVANAGAFAQAHRGTRTARSATTTRTPPPTSLISFVGNASACSKTWARNRPGGWRTPVAVPDAGALRGPATNPSVTWIGHATVLLRVAGKNMLIDPIFSERASPVPFAGPKRIAPLPIDVPDLPSIDVVMITHNHYDHLDEPSVRRLAAMPGGHPRFLVPLGLKPWFTELGIDRVEELDWWQSVGEGSARITFVPVQHWSRRTFTDRDQSLWGGWAIEGEGIRVIHLGDTGYSPDFRDIGERLGPFDLALIPIGAYAPRWFMRAKHLDAAEAIQVRADLRARRAIGIHWGTFPMADDPPDEAPQILARERDRAGLAAEDFDVMAIGETRRLR